MGVGAGPYVYDVVVKEFTFAISSPDKFLYYSRKVHFLHAIMLSNNSVLINPSFTARCTLVQIAVLPW